MRCRVAYIVSSFHRGGLERCVARLVDGLPGGEFEPLVVCLTESGAAAEWIERDDVPVFELHKRSGNDLRAVRELSRVLRRERVDIVHSHNWATLMETTLARKWAGTPVHVHAQRGMFHHGRNAGAAKQAVRRAATRWACGRANAVVAVADSVRDDLVTRWGVAEDRIDVIPNGVSIPKHDATGETAKQLRQSLEIPAGAVVIGSVGRFVPVKDFPTLVRAMSLVPANANVHLVLVGDGPERGEIEAVARAMGVSQRIHLVGEQANVGDWLAMMDVYVNCSLSEGMSQSILEAMAMGLPLVVTDVGENAGLVGTHDSCGLVVPAGDAQQMASAIGAMQAENVRAEFGKRATARHRTDFALNSMLQSYERLYDRLMADESRRRHPRKTSVVTDVEPAVRELMR